MRTAQLHRQLEAVSPDYSDHPYVMAARIADLEASLLTARLDTARYRLLWQHATGQVDNEAAVQAMRKLCGTEKTDA